MNKLSVKEVFIPSVLIFFLLLSVAWTTPIQHTFLPTTFHHYNPLASPTPTSTSTPTPTPPPTATYTATSTSTYTPSPTFTPTSTMTPTPTPGQPYLIIGYIKYSGRDEYIRIDNIGSGPQTMTGWKIHSVVGDQWYYFPWGYVLQSGTSVYVHSGPDATDNPPTDLRWTTNYIWNNSGDKAVLYNGGTFVDDYCYGSGCP